MITVKSIYRTSQILDLLCTREGMTVTEISARLRLPKSTVHNILSTLVHLGMLEKDLDGSRYHLGLKLFQIGTKAQEKLEIRRVATPIIRTLNERLDETVHLTILDNGEVLYVECFESTKRLRTYSVLGVRAPLHCTAVGKAIMAFLREEDIEKIVKTKGLEKFTENTIVDKARLLRELGRVAKRGYSTDNMEHEEGVRGIAAPIRDFRGTVFASVSIAGPSQRIKVADFPRYGRLVIDTTSEISRRLGYLGS
jgi:IclR family KDG regulon transcriptional repressor